MKIIRATDLDFVPASHEDPQNSGVLKKVLARKDDLIDGRVQMINWALLPADKTFEAHYHEDMQEVFVILSGSAEITIGTETETLERGDTVLIPVRAIHQMRNIGTIDAEYIAIGVSRDGKGQTVNA